MNLNETEVNLSTAPPEGQGLLKVDPEPCLSAPSSKTGIGAVERVNNYLQPFLRRNTVHEISQ
jgi:hypothetical protein